jgi:hypothetical protein
MRPKSQESSSPRPELPGGLVAMAASQLSPRALNRQMQHMHRAVRKDTGAVEVVCWTG